MTQPAGRVYDWPSHFAFFVRVLPVFCIVDPIYFLFEIIVHAVILTIENRTASHVRTFRVAAQVALERRQRETRHDDVQSNLKGLQRNSLLRIMLFVL